MNCLFFFKESPEDACGLLVVTCQGHKHLCDACFKESFSEMVGGGRGTQARMQIKAINSL